jgi:hypothetical protein
MLRRMGGKNRTGICIFPVSALRPCELGNNRKEPECMYIHGLTGYNNRNSPFSEGSDLFSSETFACRLFIMQAMVGEILMGPCHSSGSCHRLLTAVARVRSQFKSCGICGEKFGTSTGFLRELLSPLTILIPPNAPYPSTIQGWCNGPISVWRTKWTQSHPTPRKLKKKNWKIYMACTQWKCSHVRRYVVEIPYRA